MESDPASLQAFSIPGSMYLSILGGAMYGVLVALPLVCFVSPHARQARLTLASAYQRARCCAI